MRNTDINLRNTEINHRNMNHKYVFLETQIGISAKKIKMETQISISAKNRKCQPINKCKNEKCIKVEFSKIKSQKSYFFGKTLRKPINNSQLLNVSLIREVHHSNI